MDTLDLELLINLVKGYGYLYNKRDKNYKDVVMKENAWQEISGTLLSTSECCQKTWLSLKDKYTRERKKVKTTASGSGVSETTKWTWYDDMSFLDAYIQERRKTISNIVLPNDVSLLSPQSQGDEESRDAENIETVEQESESSSHSSQITEQRECAPTPNTSRRTKGASSARLSGHLNDVDAKIVDTLATITNKPKPTADYKFGELVAAELQSMEDDRKRGKKRRILAILFED